MSDPEKDATGRNVWRRRLLELALWAAVAILIALILVYASDRWIPANF